MENTVSDIVCLIFLLILVMIIMSICFIPGIFPKKSKAEKAIQKRKSLIKKGKLKMGPNGHAIRL